MVHGQKNTENRNKNGNFNIKCIVFRNISFFVQIIVFRTVLYFLDSFDDESLF
jgi:hypothetical protein